MGRIISSYIFPHPPIIIPEVGRGGEKDAAATIEAVRRAATDIKNDAPTTIIITSPHAPIFSDYLYVSFKEKLTGDLRKFGQPSVKLSYQNNIPLADKICKLAKQRGISAGGIEERILRGYNLSAELDHGVLVPLYFVNQVYKDFKLVHMSISGLPYIELYRFGMCIKDAVAESDEKVVFLASGDLSHKLSENGPYGYNKSGPEFDRILVESVKKVDVETLIGLSEDFCENAGECGLRSFLIMFGALDGYDLRSEIYSYEGPYGVGYSVARIETGASSHERELLQKIEQKNKLEIDNLRKAEDPYVALARETLEKFIREGKIMKVPDGLPQEMLQNRAGVFVSIKKHGQLRGCIGTINPIRKNIAEEIIYNSISSGTKDPRFEPVEENELESLVYSVDVLGEAEPVDSIDQLDVIRYGVIVRSGYKSGLLLPNLEGVDTPEKQLSIALQKADIKRGDTYSIERFEVVRHK